MERSATPPDEFLAALDDVDRGGLAELLGRAHELTGPDERLDASGRSR